MASCGIVIQYTARHRHASVAVIQQKPTICPVFRVRSYEKYLYISLGFADIANLSSVIS